MERVSCPSPNFDARPIASPVDILLLHYTGMETGAAALARLCDPQARVSAHYTVDEDGTLRFVLPEGAASGHEADVDACRDVPGLCALRLSDPPGDAA